uniref:Uncharacterized protein n=1 Tax=Anguilla anguilla TaxID=7936 RepID=A0A0E9P7C8_ANGAN
MKLYLGLFASTVFS